MADDASVKPKVSPEARRVSKAERRAKQRELNLVRAEKMQKARLADETVYTRDDSRLPVLNIGCSGWFYWDWREKFYPSQLPTSQWFPYYAEHFDTVELNAPFYAWPSIATVKTWLRQAQSEDFIYTIKVSELITHVRQFKDVKGLIEDFGYIADLLGPQMGCFLYQLPPSYHYSRDKLDGIVGQLDHNRRNVVEFRHPSWWNEEVYAAFRDHGTIFCACSGPKLPDELVRTANEIYVRFHGTERWYNHLYTMDDMAEWARRIAGSGASRVWAYFNNDYHTNAITNARQLREALIQMGFGSEAPSLS